MRARVYAGECRAQSDSPEGALRAALPAAPPPLAEPFAAIRADLDELIVPALSHFQHPGFFGYFPSNSLLASVLGDYLGTGLAQLGLNWASSPALTELETVTTDWFRQMLGLSPAWSGVIQDTASTASLVALMCARERVTNYGAARGGLQSEPAPLIVYGLSTSDPYYTDNWGSTYRILTEFTTGAITYLIVCRFLPGDRLSEPASPRVERTASVLSVVLPILVVLGAVFLSSWAPAQPPTVGLDGDVEPLPPYYHLLLVPLLICWIGALALSRRGIARFLSTRALVLGGFISYSLYMTHLVWFGLWRAGMRAAGVENGPLYALAFVVLVVGALVLAWLMWRFVEEPAREWMRGLVGVRRRPTEEAGEAIAEADRADHADEHAADPVDVATAATDPFVAQDPDPDGTT